MKDDFALFQLDRFLLDMWLAHKLIGQLDTGYQLIVDDCRT